jgi:hypothetical protein
MHTVLPDTPIHVRVPSPTLNVYLSLTHGISRSYGQVQNHFIYKKELNSSETSCDKIKRGRSKCGSILLIGQT